MLEDKDKLQTLFSQFNVEQCVAIAQIHIKLLQIARIEYGRSVLQKPMILPSKFNLQMSSKP